MDITKLETTLIPQSLEGQKFADEYEKRLKDQYAFRGRKEDATAILINAEYHFVVKEQSE